MLPAYLVLRNALCWFALFEKMEKVQMDLQEKHSFSRRRISCSFAKAVSKKKLEKGEILYELYHRFSLCDGNLSPYDSIQVIKLSDERH